MEKAFITFEVTNQQIVRTDDFAVVSGSKHYLHARFRFTSDWPDRADAVFSGAGCTPYRIPIVAGECEVPWEVLLRKRFYVGCVAGDRITSDAAAVDVKISGAPSCTMTPNSVLEKQIGDLSKLETEAKENLVDAINEVHQTGGGGPGGPKDAVRYGVDQNLNEEQQKRARRNIGAGAVADISAQVSQAEAAAEAASGSAQTAGAAADRAEAADRGASASAETARGRAEAAAGSAQTASTKAGEATRAASTATGNAEAAAGSAQTATAKAEEAAGSAQTAASEATRAQEAADGIAKTAVLFTPQELTPEQQEQAQKNIGITGEGGNLPAIGPDDEGKILAVVDGKPMWVTPGVPPEKPVYGNPLTDVQSLKLAKGQSKKVGVKLDQAPSKVQSVDIIAGGPAISVTPSELTFTPSDFGNYQYVTVTAASVQESTETNVILRNGDPLMTESFIPVSVAADGYSVDTTIPSEGRYTVTRADFTKTEDYQSYVRLYGYKGSATNIVIPSQMEDGKIPSVMTDGHLKNQAFPADCGVQYVTFEDGVKIGSGGEPVNMAADSLFRNVNTLIGVSNLPKTITTLNSAFEGCENLKFIDNLSELVETKGLFRAFTGSGVEYIQDLSAMTKIANAQRAFSNCKNLKRVYGLPNGKYSLNATFEQAISLQSVDIPETAIDLFYTFVNCANLRQVRVYSREITKVDGAFNGCKNLTVSTYTDSTTYNTLVTNFGSNPEITITEIDGAELPTVVIWGDSNSNQGRTWKEWPARLAEKLSGTVLNNQAVSGETTASTAARQGGNALSVNAFTIPEEVKAVPIILKGKDGQTFDGFGPVFSCGGGFNPCEVGGVSGIISKTSGGNHLTFFRVSPGRSTEVPRESGVVSQIDGKVNNSNAIMLVFLGANSGWNEDPNLLITQVQSMIDHFTAKGGSQYIICGQCSGYMLRADAQRQITFDYEKLASAKYGDHWLNLREYLIENGLRENGLIATESDKTRMALGQIPGSLLGGGGLTDIPAYPETSNDDAHLNAYGQSSTANAFYAKGQQLGYWA